MTAATPAVGCADPPRLRRSDALCALCVLLMLAVLLPAAVADAQRPFYPRHWYAPVTTSELAAYHEPGNLDQQEEGGLEVDERPAPENAWEPFRYTYEGPVYLRGPGGRLRRYRPRNPTAPAKSRPGPQPHLLVPGVIAQLITVNTNRVLAAAPMAAPKVVKEVLWAGNELVGKPYLWGGGHQSWHAPGYDCSGSVSYALHAAGLLEYPYDSTLFERYGERGVGTWITLFTDTEHVYMTVAGVRFDTVPADDPGGLPGPRWRPLRRGNERGFHVRRP